MAGAEGVMVQALSFLRDGQTLRFQNCLAERGVIEMMRRLPLSADAVKSCRRNFLCRELSEKIWFITRRRNANL